MQSDRVLEALLAFHEYLQVPGRPVQNPLSHWSQHSWDLIWSLGLTTLVDLAKQASGCLVETLFWVSGPLQGRHLAHGQGVIGDSRSVGRRRQYWRPRVVLAL